MLPQKNRLNKREELARLWKAAQKKKSQFFLIRFQKSPSLHNRFAIFVPNRIDRRSTVRNRLRRQIREIVRLNLEDWEKTKEKKNIIVLLLKVPTTEKYFQSLKEDLEKCLKSLL